MILIFDVVFGLFYSSQRPVPQKDDCQTRKNTKNSMCGSRKFRQGWGVLSRFFVFPPALIFIPLRYFNGIWHSYIYAVKKVSHAIMIALPFLFFSYMYQFFYSFLKVLKV